MKNRAQEHVSGDVPRPGSVDQGDTRRPYTPPTLIEYGTVARLTQGAAGSGTDFAMRMMVCL